jgi:membrane-associated protease RseP (regulator of RpoE activity)
MFLSRYFTGARRVASAGLGLTAALSVNVAAQQGVALTCPAGSARVATLGYAELECSNCTISLSEEIPGTRIYEFRSEPKIGGIKAGGPAAGKLKDGDVIAAIDGHLITTREGGRRFGQLEIGKSVTLTVRRGSREIDMVVTPAAKCERASRARAARAPRAVRAPQPARAPRPAARVRVPAPPAAPAQKARLGFSLRCSNCTMQHDGDEVVWSFWESPTIRRVEGGSPAYKAGVRRGDTMTHINEVLLTTDEGGRLFGAIEPGDTVTLRLERNGVERRARVVADSSVALARSALRGARAQARGVARAPRPDSDEARFSGTIGDALVQVTGGPITVTRNEDEIVIRSQDITVRIKKAGGL